jgi:hypothetical protein
VPSFMEALGAFESISVHVCSWHYRKRPSKHH